MDYRRSLDYLYGLQQFGIKLGLDNVCRLLARLGNPQDSLAVVHVAGTNGKGSTASALAALLQAGGQRIGLYTSPHLHSFTERIRVDGVAIPESEVAALADEIRRHVDGIPVTFFEFTTVMALLHFARQRVDRAVLETGLGGRLDATNAVCPELSLLTPVALDHAAYLGDSLAAIATEKAGIIKPGIPVLSATQQPEALQVIVDRAQALQAPLRVAGRDWRAVSSAGRLSFAGRRWQLTGLPQTLPGRHQEENLGLALAAAEWLTGEDGDLDPGCVAGALGGLRWPGRLEWWQGAVQVLLDGAHNPAAAAALADYLATTGGEPYRLVAAFKDDKDWPSFLAALAPHCEEVFFAPLAQQPSIAPLALVKQAAALGLVASRYSSVSEALWAALDRPGRRRVLVAGSLFLVAEARTELLGADGYAPADPLAG